MKKVIILMGVPGCGKGTQALKLAEKLNYGNISTGNLLRDLDSDLNADPHDKKLLEDMKAGMLVPNKLIYKLAFKEIEKNFAENKGVILDGAIRSVEQAKEYQAFFEEKGVADDMVVIDVNISDYLSLKRLIHRKDTSKEVRSDDTLEVMKKRIKEQGNEAIKPVLYYYESLGLLKRVDGKRSIEEVYESILDILYD
jgi:adenylate kinase